MHLTAAVYSHAQQDGFVGALDAPAFQGVRQEGQIRHHDAMRFLDIIQPLDKIQQHQPLQVQVSRIFVHTCKENAM